jgi:hypothetical protein
VCLLRGTFCQHFVFMCFVWIWEQTSIISLYIINWLVFITESECVYCAVRFECLHSFQLNLRLQTVITVQQCCVLRSRKADKTDLRNVTTWQASHRTKSSSPQRQPSLRFVTKNFYYLARGAAVVFRLEHVLAKLTFNYSWIQSECLRRLIAPVQCRYLCASLANTCHVLKLATYYRSCGPRWLSRYSA